MTPEGSFIGTDLVYVPGFAGQLEIPGTRFLSVFSPVELQVAGEYPAGRRRAEHLAGRWAAKEAFVKAWSQARTGHAPAMARDEMVWHDLSTSPDAWGRLTFHVAGHMRDLVDSSLGRGWSAQVSISHDGDYALAVCLVRCGKQAGAG